MTGLRRSLGLLAALPLLAAAAASLPKAIPLAPSVDEVQDLYLEGVDLWQKGQKTEALDRFTRVLALDPSNEAAYELWKSTEADIILELLVEGGQYEIVARRFLDIATLARQQRQNDEDAIRELLRSVNEEDALVRRRAVLQLASNHGEYAVPYMLPTLADPDAGERRVYFMQALTSMDTDVVLPLLAALDLADPYLRRNVAIVLGHIGDHRAAAELTLVATTDADQGVRTAAKDAAMACGSNGNALALFLRAGDDYHHRRANVLRAGLPSEVVWSAGETDLVATPVPAYLYADELSKNSYYGALTADPNSLDARAGLARAYVAQQAQLMARAMAGLEDEGVAEQLAEASVAVNSTGVDALDKALEWSVQSRDLETGIALCRVLSGVAKEPTPGLWKAFQEGDGALSGEASVAMGAIAFANNQPALPPVVDGLGKAASLEVLRLVVVMDGDESRGASLASALSGRNMVVDSMVSGIRGLNLLRRVPGVDAIVVTDVLPDISVAQVLAEVARDERTANVPVVLVSANTEAATEAYGDRVAAVIPFGAGAAELDAIEGAMTGGLGADRERANDLAGRAASALELLARGSGRTDLSPALGALASTLAMGDDGSMRPDAVTVPAMGALAAAGMPSQVEALLGVLGNGAASPDARVAAADAIGDIAARTSMSIGPQVIEVFGAVLVSDADLSVRQAASRALGRMQLSAAQRAEIAQTSRVNVGG